MQKCVPSPARGPLIRPGDSGLDWVTVAAAAGSVALEIGISMAAGVGGGDAPQDPSVYSQSAAL